MTKKCDFHPVANIFPMLSEPELKALSDDIAANGLMHPIWLHQDQIVDGRNRYNACKMADVEPRFQDWDGNGNLIDFVLSTNLHRRHLTESQRAMVAANIANMTVGGDKKSDHCANLHNDPSVSQTQAAEKLSVSRRSVAAATKVRSKGTAELVAAVELGQVAVSTAATVATLPKQEQSEAVAGGKEGVKEAAKKVKESKAKDKPLPGNAVITHDTLTPKKESEKDKPKDEPIPDEQWLASIPIYRVLHGLQHRGIVVRRAALDYRKVEKSIATYCRNIASTESVKGSDSNFFADALLGPRTITPPESWGVCPPCRGNGCERCGRSGFEMNGGIDPARIENGEVDL